MSTTVAAPSRGERSTDLIVIGMMLHFQVNQPDIPVRLNRRRGVVVFVRAVGQLPAWRDQIRGCPTAQLIPESAIRELTQPEIEVAARCPDLDFRSGLSQLSQTITPLDATGVLSIPESQSRRMG